MFIRNIVTNWEGNTQTAVPISKVNHLAMYRIFELFHLEVGLTHVTGVRACDKKPHKNTIFKVYGCYF